MRVEKKSVLVGIRMDGQSRELLNWAIVKVAEPGDSVIAAHVVRNPDTASKNKPLLDNYLEVYEGICNKRKVDLRGQILTGSSIRNVLVRETKKHNAVALVLGTSNHSFGGRVSTAKHCAKRLPTTTNVISIQDGRIVYRSCNNNQPTGEIEDPKPSLTRFDSSGELTSEFAESEVETEKPKCKDSGREHATEILKEANFRCVQRGKRVLTRSLSLFTGNPSKQKLGWPLLRKANSGISQILHARNMSVVEWAMSLPDRSPRMSFGSSFIGDNPSERSNSDIEDESFRITSSPSAELQQGFLNISPASDCKLFSLEVLKSWTSKFSSENLVGKGGSNFVYKGILPDGKPIAVKVLKSSKEAWKEFSCEMEIISSLKHRNITPPLGICIEDNSLISVYDYFPKGSLEESLHGKNKDRTLLSWEKRFNIAIGIAEALNYLHNETVKPVIHRDVKSANILLSYGFEPQLSDFGLAIWGPTSSSFLTEEDVVGTFGYLAPEYFMYGKLSDKVDVYAFGVVLLELISGRKPISSETCSQESLVVRAKTMIESGNVNEILDPNLHGKFDEPQMERMVWAASLCITRAARLRPKMNQILSILKGHENVENFLDTCGLGNESSENQENIDDEVYPHTSAELHLNLALLDVDLHTKSSSDGSPDQINSLSFQQHLKER